MKGRPSTERMPFITNSSELYLEEKIFLQKNAGLSFIGPPLKEVIKKTYIKISPFTRLL